MISKIATLALIDLSLTIVGIFVLNHTEANPFIATGSPLALIVTATAFLAFLGVTLYVLSFLSQKLVDVLVMAWAFVHIYAIIAWMIVITGHVFFTVILTSIILAVIWKLLG